MDISISIDSSLAEMYPLTVRKASLVSTARYN